MSTQVDLNNTACIVQKDHLGYTDFVNICSGKITSVDWTGMDWAGFTFLSLLTLVMIGIIGFVIYMMVRD